MPSLAQLLAGLQAREIRPRAPVPDADPETLCRRALEPTAHRWSTAAEIVAVVNDDHRATDTAAALRALAALAPAARVRVVVATGSHRAEPEERHAHEALIQAALGARLAGVVWHDATNEAAFARVRRWRVNGVVARAPVVVAIGSAEPHYFAGVTGAHKTCTIGVFALEDIERNHAHALSPAAAPLRIEGNPVAEDVLEAAGALADGRTLVALNQVVACGRVVACSAGTPAEALRAALPVVREVFAHSVAAPAAVVVARVAPPLDRDLYQADKGIKNVEAAVRDGGTLLLDARCPRGGGPDQFLSLLAEAPDHAAALAVVATRGYRLGDHKAVRLRALQSRGVRIGVLCSAAAVDAVRRAGLDSFADAAAAARWVLDGATPGPALIVEDAGNVVVEVPEVAG